jgi:hypothetical protein
MLIWPCGRAVHRADVRTGEERMLALVKSGAQARRALPTSLPLFL